MRPSVFSVIVSLKKLAMLLVVAYVNEVYISTCQHVNVHGHMDMYMEHVHGHMSTFYNYIFSSKIREV